MSAILGTALHIANDLSSMGKMKHKPVQSPFSASISKYSLRFARKRFPKWSRNGSEGTQATRLSGCEYASGFSDFKGALPEFKVWPLPHWQRELGSMAIATF